jgi:hypothetical protein
MATQTCWAGESPSDSLRKVPEQHQESRHVVQQMLDPLPPRTKK